MIDRFMMWLGKLALRYIRTWQKRRDPNWTWNIYKDRICYHRCCCQFPNDESLPVEQCQHHQANEFNPDSNQLIEAADKALKEMTIIAGRVEELSLKHLMEVGIKQALRDFVTEAIK